MNTVDLGLVALSLLLALVLCLGVRAAAVRAGSPGSLPMVVAAALAAWLLLTALLARSGALAVGGDGPPRILVVPLTAFAAVVLITRRAGFRRLVAQTPLAWVVGLQGFRVGVELLLYGLHVDGRAPVQLTFEGRNFDILAGLTAPLVAWALASSHRWARALAWVWNVISAALLANIIFTAATSVPGPLFLDWQGGAFTAVTTWPVVWIPGFLAPVAVFLHVVWWVGRKGAQ